MPLSFRIPLLAVLGAALGLSPGCGRDSLRYSAADLDAALADPDNEAGLVVGEFALAPGAIVDGDTIKVGGLGSSLRLLGLDTEETFKSKKDLALYEDLGFDGYLEAKRGDSDRPVKCATPLGTAAKKYAMEFFKGDITVRLERDDPKDLRGRFDRVLTYVFAKRGGVWVNYNVEAVRAGMSPYFTKYGYSRRFHDEFVQAQEEARAAGVGIWEPGTEHYRDYDLRLAWWNKRAEFIERFEEDAKGRDDLIMLGQWDALDRIAAAEGREVEILAGVGEIYRREGNRPTRVMLSRKMFSDFPLIFFDEDIYNISRIEDARGEFVRVRGTVTSYEYKSRRKRDKDRVQLQMEVKVPNQVVISDTAPDTIRMKAPGASEPVAPQKPPAEPLIPAIEPGVATPPPPPPVQDPEPAPADETESPPTDDAAIVPAPAADAAANPQETP